MEAGSEVKEQGCTKMIQEVELSLILTEGDAASRLIVAVVARQASTGLYAGVHSSRPGALRLVRTIGMLE
jgi:hypothetical protein